jgi:hypothetical protein
MQSNIFAPEPAPRFKLIHTLSGQTVAKAHTLQALRNVIDEADANYFTLHDLQEGEYSGASRIFKEAVKDC